MFYVHLTNYKSTPINYLPRSTLMPHTGNTDIMKGSQYGKQNVRN